MKPQPKTKRQLCILGMCLALWIITLFVADSYFPGQIAHILLISVIVAMMFTAWAMGIVAEYLTWYFSMEEDEY